MWYSSGVEGGCSYFTKVFFISLFKMKVSQLIEKLQRVQSEVGDLEVKITDGFDGVCYSGDFYVGDFEFDDDEFIDIGIGGMKIDVE